MTEAILLAIQAVSFVVIVIIMAVMANTMAMTARERGAEYATMKALGFSGGFVALLILAESLGIALAGGLAAIALTFPLADAFAERMGSLFPIFFVSEQTMLMQVGAALLVGVVAAALPAWRDGARCASSTACGRSGEERRSRCDAMTIPFSYILRNVAARRLTTALTAGGMALVVYVFATVLMLAAGLEQTLVATGQDDNVVVIRRAAQTEVQSGVDRRQAGIVESLPDIAIGRDGAEAHLEGAGRPHQSAEARLEQAVERRDPRRDAGRARAAAAGEARRRAGCSGRGRPRSSPDARSPTASRAPASARRCASRRATGRSSASSTRAAPASIRRSGATPSRCCRRSAGSASRRWSSGSPTPTASTR